MAIPSGSGTEVLRRGVVATQSSTATSFKFDGTNPSTGTSSYTVPANHIITIISIIVCEAAGSAETFDFQINDGTTTVAVLEDQALAGYATFVWNNKFSVIGGDKFIVQCSSADVDFYYTYLDQDWS